MMQETNALEMIRGWHMTQRVPKFGSYHLGDHGLFQNAFILAFRDQRHHDNDKVGFVFR